MRAALFAVMALALAGCAGYSWRSEVPAELRTVAVPTFENRSDVTELGAVVTAQLLREFQREGTFRIRRAGDAAVEVQGVIEKVDTDAVAYSRRSGLRNVEYGMKMTARVSVIDKTASRVVVDDRRYVAQTTFVANDDVLTGERNASGRLAEDLARQVVDDVTMTDFSEKGESK